MLRSFFHFPNKANEVDILARLLPDVEDVTVELCLLWSCLQRLKADSMIRVNQIVTIFLIKSSIHLLDQYRYPVSTSSIHIEFCKSPTAVLFDVNTGRISIRHCETKEYPSECSGKISRIMRKTL
ncbi:hypothetical protein Tco_1333860 [Tanacetum coccineum]